MTHRRHAFAGLLVLGALTGAGCGGGGEQDGAPRGTAAPASVAKVIAPAPGAPEAPVPAAPAAGEVVVADGPFTDRLRFLDPTLRGERLRGGVMATVDVSELLSLVVRADFYDREGRHLGERRRAWQGELEPIDHEDEALRFSLAAPRGGAVAAVLSVEDYVPE